MAARFTPCGLRWRCAEAQRITRIDIEGDQSAGATLLVDERWRRRPVGIAASANPNNQPLLSEIYYLERALDPFTEVRQDTMTNLLAQGVSVLAVPDSEALDPDTRVAIRTWHRRLSKVQTDTSHTHTAYTYLFRWITQQLADQLANYLIEHRADFDATLIGVDEAVEEAAATARPTSRSRRRAPRCARWCRAR